jgi:hypothetical protein
LFWRINILLTVALSSPRVRRCLYVEKFVAVSRDGWEIVFLRLTRGVVGRRWVLMAENFIRTRFAVLFT